MVQSLRDGFRLGLLQLQYFFEFGNGECGFGTPKPSGHQQLLAIGSSDRLDPNVIPKRHQSGKWHLILDLSSPAGHSVNDGTAGEDYSLQYMKVDDIIAGIMRLGQSSLMAKFDVQNAYRIEPVRTEDRKLLGMKWRGAFYVDMVLPFGIRSAP